MNLNFEEELSRNPVIKEVNILRNQIDDIRPLSPDVEKRILDKLCLDWNYHSNAIEGNRLNYNETLTFLNTGVTVKGKPFQDHLDLRGHDDALHYLITLVKSGEPISEIDINVLHKMVLAESGNTRLVKQNELFALNRVLLTDLDQTVAEALAGDSFHYSNNNDSSLKMQGLMDWYYQTSEHHSLHPLVIASLFHQKLIAINAFDETSGKMARMIMNFILMHHNYPPVIIKMEDRQTYYALTTNVGEEQDKKFVDYVAEAMINSLNLYLDNPAETEIDDVDKELALFVRDLRSKSLTKLKATGFEISNTVVQVIIPLMEHVLTKTALIEDFFDSTDKKVNMVYLKTARKPYDVEIKDIHFTNLMAEKMIKPVLRPENKMMRMEFNIHFRKFKTEERKFDVRSTLFIKFDDYEYSLSNYNNELEITKAYSERLSDEDINAINKTLIRDIKKYIQDRIG
ncbi:Fic family protein [Mucilaginibacter sp. HMF5004]|uniref:Fic family protein n=1 Tax=Mucilaginibacter rivuli TaxID=2857527 RepID=UPI001C5F679E|nr:Fic family protein [Mucilaginibacter rivuli]MBW4889331.1 Fic family protein [Mucilaginibacter rivuli]